MMIKMSENEEELMKEERKMKENCTIKSNIVCEMKPTNKALDMTFVTFQLC